MQTSCGLSHIDYSVKHNISYSTIFNIMDDLGVDFEDKYELFRRMIFNVVTSNYDDHAKNFSFLMDRRGKWSLSPAYDLTYSNDPNSNYINNHQCLINGKSDSITAEDCFAVGLEAGLTKPKMQRIVEEVCEAVKQWIHFAEQSDIPESKAREDFVNFHFVF